MRLTFLGSGDAFGSGGRFNTCMLVEEGAFTLALDFGATSLVAMKKAGLDPRCLDAVVLSHLHGDHYGGLPFLLLDYQFERRREAPLVIAGPIGTAARLDALLEAMFPGASAMDWRFPLAVAEIPCGEERRLGPFAIETREVVHWSGAPATGVRLAAGGRLLAYSGDTAWTEALIDVARDADLYVSECYRLADAPPNHLDLATIEANRARFGAARIVLTHMSEEVLAQADRVAAAGYILAADGLSLAV